MPTLNIICNFLKNRLYKVIFQHFEKNISFLAISWMRRYHAYVCPLNRKLQPGDG